MGNNPVLYTDPSGEFGLIPLLLVGAAGGFLGGLGYYALQQYMQADPCTGMQWDWGQALFWGGVGTVMGAGIGGGIYGGWWVGVQLGWWGPTVGPTILWLEQNVNRVRHIMAPKHAWNRLVTLPGNLLEDYRAVQPIIQQVLRNVSEPRVLGVNDLGQRVLEFVGTVNGETVVVRVIETSENVYQISNAFVKTLP